MNIFSFFPNQQRYKNLLVHLCQEKRQALALVDLALIEQAIEQHESQLLQQVLSTAEQKYFQRFKYMKRKKEWLGGRLAAKAAILALPAFTNGADQALPGITVLPNKHGRPCLEQLPSCLPARSNQPVISISHSDDFAVALARLKGICGLDLQTITTRLAGLTDHFATDAEMQLLAEQAACDEDTRLTMLWTVKEALKKGVLHDQSVIFSETELHQLTRLNESINEAVWRFICTVQGHQQSVLVHCLSPYILSITEDHYGEEHA